MTDLYEGYAHRRSDLALTEGRCPPPNGGLNVIANDNPDTELTTRETTGPGGTRQLEIAVEGVIQKSLATNGALARQLQGMYGLNRMAGRR